MKRDAIDWNSVRARLEANRAATASAVSPGPDRVEAVLRERARRLACKVSVDGGEGRGALVFKTGSGRYAFELTGVLEVLAAPPIAAVPGAPPELAGVVQVRGEIRPVWKLAQLIGLPDEGVNGSDVILLKYGAPERGLIVGDIEGTALLRPPEDQRQPSSAGHVKWITGDLICVLDPSGLWREEG